jgi:hypothetical protein
MHGNVRLLFDVSWCFGLYLAIVAVRGRFNLWRKPNSFEAESLIWEKHWWPKSADVQSSDTNRWWDVEVSVSSVTLYDTISFKRWPNADAKQNSSICHPHEHDNLLLCMAFHDRMLAEVAWCDHDNTIMSTVGIASSMGVQILEDDYEEMAFLRHWEDILGQDSTVNNLNNEDNLTLVLSHLSLRYNHSVLNSSMRRSLLYLTSHWETINLDWM